MKLRSVGQEARPPIFQHKKSRVFVSRDCSHRHCGVLVNKLSVRLWRYFRWPEEVAVCPGLPLTDCDRCLVCCLVTAVSFCPTAAASPQSDDVGVACCSGVKGYNPWPWSVVEVTAAVLRSRPLCTSKLVDSGELMFRWPGAGIMEDDDRQVTTVFTVQTSFHHRHSLTEYHEALLSLANVQSHLTSSFADDGTASWYSVCRVPMVEWRLDCENCRHLTVVVLHDTGPWGSVVRTPVGGSGGLGEDGQWDDGQCSGGQGNGGRLDDGQWNGGQKNSGRWDGGPWNVDQGNGGQ